MIKMFKNLNKKEMLFILISILLIVLQVYLDLKVPDFMSEITKLVQSDSNSLNSVLVYGIYMMLCSLGSLVCAILIGYLAAYTGTSFEKRLRKKVFDKVQNFGMEEIKKFSTSSLIIRSTNDVTQVKMFIVLSIQMLAKTPIMATMAILKIAGKEFNFSLITLIGVIIVILMDLIVILVAIPKFRVVQKLTDNLNTITRENLTGIRVVRAYNAEKHEQDKFSKANNELTDTHLFIQKIMALLNPVLSTIMGGMSLAIYVVGATLISKAMMADKLLLFSDMVVFSSYSVQIIISFMLLTVLFIVYPRSAVSMNRISEVLDENSKIIFGKVKKSDDKLSGCVEFNNVSFKYPDAEEYALKNISFKAKKGDTVAIIGSTGCGKSTLVNLIPRFYDTSEGDITIDGINIKDYDESFLYSKIGYVSQKAVMFKGTVQSNIAFGKMSKKVDADDISSALKVSCAHEFVSKMEDKEKSEIAQSGTNISGGQKQRLSIARAVAKKPEIYIFDDSFSALDYKTDYEVRKKLDKYTKNATKFIVSSRIGTIKDADTIIVLDDGVVSGIGTHKELLKNCKVYREIAESQLSKEEIKNAWA